MFLKDKASFNVDWLDGYHAANEANSIPVIGSDGKLPIAIVPTGTGSNQVALGNHGHDSYVQGSNSSRTTDQNGNNNDITKSGFYRSSATPSSSNILPGGLHSHILHGQHPSITNYAYQIGVPYNSDNQMYFRSKCNSTTWGDWRQIWHSGNLTFGTGNNNMARGNHTHTAADVGARPNTWLPSKAEIESILTGIITSHSHNPPVNITGNSSTADKLKTPRKIGITGGITGTGTDFDGSANINIPVTQIDLSYAKEYNILGRRSILDIHPEGGGVLIPFINNDLSFLTRRGGSYTVTKNGAAFNLDLYNAFDGTPSYSGDTVVITDTVVIEITCHRTFTWSTTLGISFGASTWRAKDIKFQVMKTGADTEWTDKITVTNYGSGILARNISHNAGTGFNKIKITLSNFNSTDFRIASIFAISYNSSGLGETFISKGGSNSIFGGLSPYANNTYNLGESGKQWNEVRGKTLIEDGTSLANKYLAKSSASSIEIVADSDKSSTAEYAMLKAGHNELKVVSSGGGGTITQNPDKLLFNNSKVYHEGYKPVIDYIKVNDTRSDNNLPQVELSSPKVKFDFRSNTAIGLSDGGVYVGVMGFRPYGSGTDWSGGPSHQLAFTDNGNMWLRRGNANGWLDWKKVIFSNEVSVANEANIIVKRDTSGNINISGLNVGNTIRDTRLTTGNTQLINATSNIIYVGNPSTSLSLESSSNPTVYINGTRYDIYHKGNKPTASDVGARPSTWIPSKADIEGQLTGTITTHTHNINTLKGTASNTVPVGSSLTAGDIKFYYNILNNAVGAFPTTDNANGILQLSRHSGGYDSQLGFSSNGKLYYRSFSGKHPDTTTTWKQLAFTDDVANNNDSWKVARKELAANTNLNDIKTGGHYVSGSDGNSQTFTNRPPGTQGFSLEVREIWMSSSTVVGRCTQVAYMRNTNDIYVRSLDESNGWSSWKHASANTWRGVVDNLTSTATDQSLSANQGRVLKGLIDGKSSSDHNHDGRYFRADSGNSTDVRLSAGDGRGLRFWDSDSYKIWMSTATNGTYGGRVAGDANSDYNIYFKISGNTRGYVFKTDRGNVAGITYDGHVKAKGHVSVGDNKVKMEYNATTESLDFIFN